MHKYKFTMRNGQAVEFESKQHISTMNAMPVNGASMLYFNDTQHAINLAQTKDVEIDGAKYQLRGYTV